MTPPVPAAPAAAEAPQPQSGMDILDSIDFSTSETPDTQSDPEQSDDQGDPPQQDPETPDDEFSLDKIFDEDEGDPEQVDQDGRNAYKMSPERMNRFVQSKKFHEAVSEFAPTVDAAREHYQRANDFNTMEFDFRNPHEPVKVKGADGQEREIPAARAWLEHWADVSPDGIGAVAEMLPQFLASSGNTRALQAVESTVLGATVSGMYRKAAQSGNPDDLVKAQNLDFALNGKFREKVDPIQQRDPRQDTLQQREQRLQQRETADINRQWGAFDQQNVSGAKQTALDTQLNQIFDSPKVKEAFAPKLLDALRNQVVSEVQKKLAADSEWSRNHEITSRSIQLEFRRALSSNQTTDLGPKAKALVADYAQRVRQHLFAVAKPIFSDATKNAVKTSQSTHARLAASSGKSSPSGAGSPVRQNVRSVVPQNLKSADLIDWALQ